jgi:hypothetical protein
MSRPGVRARRNDHPTHDEQDEAMHTVQIQDYARRLLESHGDRAPAEAAQKAVAFEKAGDKAQAETWRRVEQALLLMRGARQS